MNIYLKTEQLVIKNEEKLKIKTICIFRFKSLHFIPDSQQFYGWI